MKKAAMPGMTQNLAKTRQTKPAAKPGQMPGGPLNSARAMPTPQSAPAAGKPTGRAAALAVTSMPLQGVGGSVMGTMPMSGVKPKRTKGM